MEVSTIIQEIALFPLKTVSYSRNIPEWAAILILSSQMVLRDQSLMRMTIDEWNSPLEPKVKGTWNLHTFTRGTKLDFFVLFSSLSGIVGQPGQANYAAANTFLDGFVQYRKSNGLPCTAIDIGAMEGVGYLFENEGLLKKMQGTGWRSVKEEQLLEALGAAILPHSSQQHQSSWSIVGKNNILLGISPIRSLESSRSRDVRMAVYHNIASNSSAHSGTGSNNDTLRSFLASAKSQPSLFREPDTAVFLAHEIGQKLFSLLLKPDQEPNIALGLAELGLDSMIAVEMRAWWKLTFALDISVLEMLGMGTLLALGRRVAEELASIYNE